MAQLVNYLLSLRQEDEIDEDIVTTITPPLGGPPFMRDIEFDRYHYSRGHWKYSHIGNVNYEFVYIPWVVGHICYGYIPGDMDFLSLPFSGCYMAVYINTEGIRCGCHIHTAEARVAGDRRADWNNYINNINQIQNRYYILFRPNRDIHEPAVRRVSSRRNRAYAFQLWGIISNDGKCYSALIGITATGINIRRYFLISIEREHEYPGITIP